MNGTTRVYFCVRTLEATFDRINDLRRFPNACERIVATFANINDLPHSSIGWKCPAPATVKADFAPLNAKGYARIAQRLTRLRSVLALEPHHHRPANDHRHRQRAVRQNLGQEPDRPRRHGDRLRWPLGLGPVAGGARAGLLRTILFPCLV
jgi:hypothetical protein